VGERAAVLKAAAATKTKMSLRNIVISPVVVTQTSGALPWFESYAGQDWTTKMLLRHTGQREAMIAADMIGFMESVY
jgi:hypothetical protein